MRDQDHPDYDVVVVGGGPGGSTVAALVAMQGHRVLLVEKERFPRYQIGESLLPATVHGIGRLLGITDELTRAGFVVKRGGTFRWGNNPDPWTFSFAASARFAGDTSTAYQVERMRFDQILLDNARRVGVEVWEESPVIDVIDEGDRVVGVSVTTDDGTTRDVRARYVVDASGNKSRIHSRVGGRRRYSEFFRNLALFGYFEGGRRLPPPNQGNILAAAFDAGWFWYIPLSDELTSVGAVVRPDALDRVRGDREAALAGLIQDCPLIAENLADARRVTSGPYGEIRVRKDYSYIQERFWRPGFVLVGDAACFIDPVFSSGVHLATYGALLAARSLNTMLAGRLDEDVCLAEFEARYRMEYTRFHDFLVGFYDMHQDEASYFWKARKVLGGAGASDLESFVELVGGGASGEDALVGAGSYADRNQAAFQELADIVGRPVGQEGEDRDLLGAALVKAVSRSGLHIQFQAAAGGNADERTPVRAGGLVPSADGLHWSSRQPSTDGSPRS
ncbi:MULTISPECIES: tryptophan 7-halogenase [Actinoalloteichus]|uniref:Flavin-dependent dehydrogenase n=1 Tax=Actinoalloteichus fjordicus TaxID=1612552 RepID=A0AAC9PSG9_9PSEU|nr:MULTISPECIES: tryptophan 7-halogenase [Actinoalloteichus]APU15544.1 flavin-dependent dehydrogenase [Actinoalloteichus fjordicus]APU21611.1 flavin-dependent dehydrogenase [Actinoalloteichus sp. GBA129-24]